MENSSSPESPSRKTGRPARSVIILTVLAVAFVVVPFLFWQGTWFGRPLKPDEIDRYLQDEKHPRKIQHALSQIAAQIVQGGADVKRWYPQMAALAKSPTMQIRLTAAWAMGQDENSQLFHDTLLKLLEDPELMVRRNAALSLVRFRDASGRGEILQMLQPYTVRTTQGGKLSIHLQPDQEIATSSLLARITVADGKETDVRSPFGGHVDAVLAADGATVSTGEALVSIRPGDDQAWEALRGLYLIGQPEDLQTVERYERHIEGSADRVRRQAVLTANSIRSRAEN